MPPSAKLVHLAFRWPGDTVPADTPERFYYEASETDDAVLRTIDLFADGRIERDSIEIEERNGHPCRSLVNTPLRAAFEGAELQEISREDFGDLWKRGEDTPAWFRW